MKVIPFTKPQRDELILRLKPIGKTYPVPFQGSIQHLNLFTVPIAMPSYRLANGRTKAAQRELIATKGLQPDFFDDPDSAAALEAQDLILRSMAKNANLLSIMSRSDQNQPLLLDSGGYVVNGNRRLCAMRMLLEQDETKFARFKHIDVVILPACTEEDIKELEGRLQVLPDGKDKYSWYSLAMMLREFRNARWSDKRIGTLYEMKPSEVKDSIQMLEDGEAYLEDRGLVGHYSLLEDKDYAFQQLLKVRKKCKGDPANKELITKLTYTMMDSPKDIGGRLYKQIPDALAHLPQVVQEIKAEFQVKETIPAPADKDDPLSGSAVPKASGTLAVIADPAHRTRVLEVVKDTLAQAEAKKNHQVRSRYCYSQAQEALTALQNAINSWNNATVVDGIVDTLAGIEQAVVELKRLIGSHANPD